MSVKIIRIKQKEVGWGFRGKGPFIGHAKFKVPAILPHSNNKQADSRFLGKRPRLEKQCAIM